MGDTGVKLNQSFLAPLGNTQPLLPAAQRAHPLPSGLKLCGGRDLLFVLQRAGLQSLPDPVWPQPKAGRDRTGSPQDQAKEGHQLFASLLAPEGARQL